MPSQAKYSITWNKTFLTWVSKYIRPTFHTIMISNTLKALIPKHRRLFHLLHLLPT